MFATSPRALLVVRVPRREHPPRPHLRAAPPYRRCAWSEPTASRWRYTRQVLRPVTAGQASGAQRAAAERLDVCTKSFHRKGFTPTINRYRDVFQNWKAGRNLDRTISVPSLMVSAEHRSPETQLGERHGRPCEASRLTRDCRLLGSHARAEARGTEPARHCSAEKTLSEPTRPRLHEEGRLSWARGGMCSAPLTVSRLQIYRAPLMAAVVNTTSSRP